MERRSLHHRSPSAGARRYRRSPLPARQRQPAFQFAAPAPPLTQTSTDTAGFAADTSNLIFESKVALLPGAVQNKPNLYEFDHGSLTLAAASPPSRRRVVMTTPAPPAYRRRVALLPARTRGRHRTPTLVAPRPTTTPRTRSPETAPGSSSPPPAAAASTSAKTAPGPLRSRPLSALSPTPTANSPPPSWPPPPTDQRSSSPAARS